MCRSREYTLKPQGLCHVKTAPQLIYTSKKDLKQLKINYLSQFNLNILGLKLRIRFINYINNEFTLINRYWINYCGTFFSPYTKGER